MYVCLCKGVTDTAIRTAIESGAKTFKHLRSELGVSSQCGKCACMTKELLAQYKEELRSFNQPLWTMA